MDFQQKKAWVAAALADGWVSTEKAADPLEVKRADRPFRIRITRHDPDFPGARGDMEWVLVWMPAGMVLWAPDGLVGLVPERYEGLDHLSLITLETCPLCYRRAGTDFPSSIGLRQYSYAGRCCPTCYDAMPPSRRAADPS